MPLHLTGMSHRAKIILCFFFFFFTFPREPRGAQGLHIQGPAANIQVLLKLGDQRHLERGQQSTTGNHCHI